MEHERIQIDGTSPQAAPLCAVDEYRDRCYSVGCAAFPRISWRAAEFASHAQLVAFFPDRVLSDEVLTDEALRDEFLRIACLAQIPGAIATLESEYLAPLGKVLAKRCDDAELADEALQTLREKLLLGAHPRLASYRSTGHLRPWLQVVGVRICQDLARQRGVRWAREGQLVDRLVDPHRQPDSLLLKAQLDELFVVALKQVFRELPNRERYALRMHVMAGWNVSQIGEALSTHRATAARWIASAKQRLSDNVRLLLRERLDLNATELEKLVGFFGTQLDLRLSQVFSATPALGANPDDPETDVVLGDLSGLNASLP
jgi:RNA polymerase sigma-70 factor (ECF subfamily)